MNDLTRLPTALPPAALAKRCDPAGLPFATTAELPPLDHAPGQDRAVAALEFAVGIKAEGYNLFALGPEGTGKLSLVMSTLGPVAAQQAAPDDWAYVHNFADPHRPLALRLPPGRGPALKRDMEHLIEDLSMAIPAAFEGEEYRTRRQLLEEQFKEQQEAAFHTVQEKAAQRQVALLRTPVGLALAPMKNGEVLSPDDFKALPGDQQARFKAEMETLQKELESRLAELPQAARDQRRKLRELDRETALAAVRHGVEEICRQWAALPAVLAYLRAVQDDVIDNLGDFLGREPGRDGEAPDGAAPLPPGRAAPQAFRRYRVNALVTPSDGSGAPVVYCAHPTQPNLVGRVEHLAQMGALITDFNLIKPGALHQANGGYLVVEARKVLLNPFAWEDLKRALRAGEIRVEPPGQSWGLFPTVSLEPEPIPLAVKVVMVGEPLLYYLLTAHDPDFAELFKVAADFDWQMDRTRDHEMGIARLIAGLSRREGLRPFAASGVARVIEQASRLVEDGDKLSTHLASLADLAREADHYAGREGAEVVAAAHVEQAVAQQIYRLDRVRSHMLEEVVRGTVLIDTEGGAVGQVNGLVVMELGRFAFGRPSRITCRVHLGRGDVVDIEREVELGGPIHSKGVMILSSFLAARFGQDYPLNLSAHLVFEQSYGEVEGDSASSAELYCLLSALAELPVRQGLAVTGSVNQNGQVQAIGGVNEKIEGFFDICRARGLDGSHGVLIPASNVPHLMLRADVVEACAAGRFAIHAVETVDQGIALLTGLPAGEADAHGEYPAGTVNRRVAARLAQFSRRARALAQDEGEGPVHRGRDGR